MTWSCWNALYRWASLEGDKPHDVYSKLAVFFFQSLIILLSMLEIWLAGPLIPQAMFAYVTLCLFIYFLGTRRLTGRLLFLQIAVACAGTSARDLYYLTYSRVRTWPFFVVVLDLLLYLNTSKNLAMGVVLFAVAHMAVMSAETAVRFGIFDLPIGLPSYDERRTRTQCEFPPCEVSPSVAFSGFTFSACIFAFDFYMTRKFAWQAQEEHAKLQATLETSKIIAALLARFDLRSADRALADREWTLPTEMAESFRMLLYNLDAYRPYLPEAVISAEAAPCESDTGTSDAMSNSSAHSRSHAPRNSLSSAPTTPTHPSCAGRNLRVNSLSLSRVSLLQCAVHWSSASDVAAFIIRHQRFLEEVMKIVVAHRGVVEAFTGDTVHSSFNASTRCASHASNAVAAAESCRRINFQLGSQSSSAGTGTCTGAVATGIVLYGTLGSSDMRRPTTIGSLVTDVGKLVHFGTQMGLPWVCNAWAFGDASTGQLPNTLRIVLGTLMLQRQADPEVLNEPLNGGFGTGDQKGPMREAIVYEICMTERPLDELQSRDCEGEWMYAMAASSNSEWELYNDVGRKFLRGEMSSYSAIQLILKSCCHKAASKADVFRAALRRAATVSMSTEKTPLHMDLSQDETTSSVISGEILRIS